MVGAPSTWAVDTRPLPERSAQETRTEVELEEGAYDLVLLLEGLERCDTPSSALQIARLALRRGGRLVILTPNAASTVATLFRGRHWSDYDFPRHVCLFHAASLRRAAEAAGLAVERLDTVACPSVWVRSAANLLQDWGAPRWLVPSLTRASAPAMALAWLAEQMANFRGKGAMLRAVLMRRDEGRR
jgi:SAM-dependent methyltransferase